jgi:hypothetical protein
MTIPLLVGDVSDRGRAAVALRFMPTPVAWRLQDGVVRRAHDFGAVRGGSAPQHLREVLARAAAAIADARVCLG